MYDFIDIPDNKARTLIIQEYCLMIKQGYYRTVDEQKELRHELVSEYLDNHVPLV